MTERIMDNIKYENNNSVELNCIYLRAKFTTNKS
jgi:hypothetical protein